MELGKKIKVGHEFAARDETEIESVAITLDRDVETLPIDHGRIR